ncbi:MAG: hypothetical protein ACR2IQ_00540 [Minisyncoccia bacterium]
MDLENPTHQSNNSEKPHEAGILNNIGPDTERINSIHTQEAEQKEYKEKLKTFLDGFTQGANEFLKEKGDTEFVATAFVANVTNLETGKKTEQPRLVFRSKINSLKEFVIELPMDLNTKFNDIADIVTERYEQATFVEPDTEPMAKDDSDIPGPASSAF